MKNLYVCERCGQTFEEYDACYTCEQTHVQSFDDYALEPELIKRYQYKPGQKAPDKIIKAARCWEWNEEQQESKEVYSLYVYKLVGEVSPTELEKILSENAERREQERIDHEKWWAEREAKKAAEASAKPDEQTA